MKSTASGQVWYRQFWPWALAAGPAAVIVAGGVTVWLALTHPEALVVDDYYKQGNAINQAIKRDRAASELNLEASLEITKAGQLALEISGNKDYAWPPVVELLLMHPTLSAEDMKVELVAQSLANGKASYIGVAPVLGQVTYYLQLQDGANWRVVGEWPKGATRVNSLRSAVVDVQTEPRR